MAVDDSGLIGRGALCRPGAVDAARYPGLTAVRGGGCKMGDLGAAQLSAWVGMVILRRLLSGCWHY